MNICLVRHTSVAMAPGVCYGQSDVPLNPSFEAEAAAAMAAIPHLSWDAVCSSPLSRCVRLADYCGYGTAVRDRRLMELNFGDWEMKPWAEIVDPNLSLWFDDYVHVKATGGESFMEQYGRVVDFLEEMKSKRYENVLLFTHGGVIESARIYAGKLTFEQLFSQTVPYGGVEMLTI